MSINQNVGNQNTCPKCGNPLRPNVKFCTNCGAKIEKKEAPAAEEPQKETKTKNVKIVKKNPVLKNEESKPEAFGKTDDSSLEGNSSTLKHQESSEETLFPNASIEQNPVENDSLEAPAFAEGLPDWDMLPPQVMVRRKKS